MEGYLDEEDLHMVAAGGSAGDVLAIIEAVKLSAPMVPEERVAACLNRRNDAKYTPLHCAIFARNLETFMCLVENGCDINIKCHGTPSLHLTLTTSVLPGGYDFGLTAALKLLAMSCDINAKDDQGITGLHLACEYNIAPVVENMLRILSLSDENGAFDDHAATEVTLQDVLETKDRKGFRALHHCCVSDAYNTAQQLLSKQADISAKSSLKASPYHVAASCGSSRVWKALVNHSFDTGGGSSGLSALLKEKDVFGRTPLDTAILYGHSELLACLPAQIASEFRDVISVVKSTDSSATVSSPPVTTAILSHPYCRLHYTCPPSATEEPSAPPENFRRLSVVVDDQHGALRSRDIETNVRFVEECRGAALTDVLRVHEWTYVRRLQALCQEIAARSGSSLEAEGGEEDEAERDEGLAHLDGDTAISKRSFDAALRAAGSLCQAVDMVMAGEVRNAFCAVRPPGHHAGPVGLVNGEAGGPDSHGFCLLNNISIGAAYAMNVHRETVKKVAIVDFDVHHGNGTEETIRWLRPGIDTKEVYTQSMFGQMHTPRFKPWFDMNDTDNVLFVSVHGYGPREKGLEQHMPAAAFYPGSGRTVLPTAVTAKDPVSGGHVGQEGAGRDSGDDTKNAMMEQERAVIVDGQPAQDEEDDEDDDSSFRNDSNSSDSDEDDTSHAAQSYYLSGESKFDRMKRVYGDWKADPLLGRAMPPLILDVGVGLPSAEFVLGEYRHQWRNYFRNQIFPRLMDFEPDMIFISAGFDAHKKDLINSGYISLVEEDYEWVTAQLIRIANSTCHGRLISALEGGYQISAEHSSAFAKSVKAHVSAMCSGAAAKAMAPYLQEDMEIEQAVERQNIDALHKKRELKQQEADRKAEAWRKHVIAMQQEHQQQQQREQQQQCLNAEQEGAVENSASTEEILKTIYPGLASAEMAEAEEIMDVDSARSKRRRTSAKVDYVALNKEL